MFRKGNIGKTIGVIVLIVVLCTGILGIIGTITKGFTDFEVRVPNEKNLIQVDNYFTTLEDKREDGLSIEVNEDGVIAVTGKNNSTEDVVIDICSVTLKAGKYTLSSSAKGTSDKTYYLVATTGVGDSAFEIKGDTEKESTFSIEEETEFTISIVVCAKESINTTFKPVLNEGDKPVDFYVISND